jgi:CobQ/CobB/MinD/ParA family nucleotide binding protein
MQKRIDTIINGKGGVGKSFFAVNLVQYLKDKSIPHVAIDTDNENSTLKRFHPEAAFLDIEDPKEIDSIFTALDTADLVVVDCRAASTDIFLDYFEELQIFLLLEKAGASMTVVSPVNHETDSVEQIRNLSERFNGDCNYLIVKNQALSERFGIYEQSKTRARLVEQLGAKEILMPKLYDWLVADLNKRDLTITPAIRHESFTLFDRQRMCNWQRRFYEELETATDILLPPAKRTRKP